MSFVPPSTHSEHGTVDERRSAIYLPDHLAAELLNVCDATAGLEPSEPGSPIHSDLDELWSGVLASSVSSVDSFRAQEVVRRFAERYGLVHCLSSANLSWLNEVENLEAPSEDLYKDLLDAAFGSPSGGTAFDSNDRDNTPQIGHSFLDLDEEVDDPPEWSPQITHLPPSLDLPGAHTYPETPRFYYNRPHTPQVIRVDLSQNNQYDFWTIPNIMKKPSFFPLTPRNIKDWIFWRRVHGGR